MEETPTPPNDSDFDAADLADAILGTGDPNWVRVAVIDPKAAPPAIGQTVDEATPAAERRNSNYLGWVLVFFLFCAVSIAISLAVQIDSDATPPRVTPPACGGLYDDCCDTWDDNWGPCEDDRHDCEPVPYESSATDRGRGLFDAEDTFAQPDPHPYCP